MKRLAMILIGLFLNFSSYAVVLPPETILDKVTFQISAKQWVSTKTALLTVSINVTLNNADLVKARSEIMERLSKIAKNEWHFIQFERSQDSSGLEKLSVQAQARVEQSSLTNVYQNAKSVSRPGANYEIASIEFKPGIEEIQQVRAELREQLYKQVYEEINRINKVYPEQRYSLYDLMFEEGSNASQPKVYTARGMTSAVAAPVIPALTISNELVMMATVQVASNRKSENRIAP